MFVLMSRTLSSEYKQVQASELRRGWSIGSALSRWTPTEIQIDSDGERETQFSPPDRETL